MPVLVYNPGYIEQVLLVSLLDFGWDKGWRSYLFLAFFWLFCVQTISIQICTNTFMPCSFYVPSTYVEPWNYWISLLSVGHVHDLATVAYIPQQWRTYRTKIFIHRNISNMNGALGPSLNTYHRFDSVWVWPRHVAIIYDTYEKWLHICV